MFTYLFLLKVHVGPFLNKGMQAIAYRISGTAKSNTATAKQRQRSISCRLSENVYAPVLGKHPRFAVGVCSWVGVTSTLPPKTGASLFRAGSRRKF